MAHLAIFQVASLLFNISTTRNMTFYDIFVYDYVKFITKNYVYKEFYDDVSFYDEKMAIIKILSFYGISSMGYDILDCNRFYDE
jgi:hypothetical protein